MICDFCYGIASRVISFDIPHLVAACFDGLHTPKFFLVLSFDEFESSAYGFSFEAEFY